jgi:1,4-alpha-glucan branching enzyme
VVVPLRPASPPAGGAPAGVVATRLSLQAPQARRVAVAGDFNGWNPEAAPLARGPGGAWTGVLELPRGRHQYMFVVDGEWVTDPAAPVTRDDGFGHRNAVLDL